VVLGVPGAEEAASALQALAVVVVVAHKDSHQWVELAAMAGLVLFL